MDALTLISRYRLQAHPEGGWYREMHRSAEAVMRADRQSRAAFTAILFLLQAGEISRWHRVHRADETWHFHAGDPLELLLLPPDGGAPQRRLLGQLQPVDSPEPLAVVPAEWWQAARTLGAFSLVSCCVAPGFEFADFSLLREHPREQWPDGMIQDLL